MSQCPVCGLEMDRCPLIEMPLPRDCLKMAPRRLRSYDIRGVVSASHPVVPAIASVIEQIGRAA